MKHSCILNAKQLINNKNIKLQNLGLKNIIMYIVFNDNTSFILSDSFPLLERYQQEAWFKEDYNCKQDFFLKEKSYYLCDQVELISPRLKRILEEEYKIYPIFNLIRKYAECNFIFTAIRGKPIADSQLFYEKNVKKFENFCVEYTYQLLPIIKNANPKYKHAFVLNNKSLLEAVIIQGYRKKIVLCPREKECLWLSSQGNTVKEIGKILKISPFTVESYFKNIRQEFNCNTLTEAVMEAIRRGIIGKFSRFD